MLIAVLLSALLGLASAAADELAPGEAFITPGQEELLAAVLGRGIPFPDGCRFDGGQVLETVINGTYRCSAGELVFELHHPSNAPADAIRTDRFAIAVKSGSPSTAFSRALASHIRSSEARFQWAFQPTPTPTPEATATVVPTPIHSSAPSSHGFALSILFGVALVTIFALVLRTSISAPSGLWLALVFTVSAGLRLWLSVLNRQSNDNHYAVAEMIWRGGWLPPAASACMECSHPKLYHYVLALLCNLAGDANASPLLGNLLNFVAGSALLALLLTLSRRIDCEPRLRVLGFAFLAFNPAIVGIFSQTTNDGFCILFSSMAIFALIRFFDHGALSSVALATIFVVLAALSKATGWVIFLSAAAILALSTAAAGDPRSRRRTAVATAILVVGFLATVPFADPYRQNLARAGTPFVNDAFEEPLNKIEQDSRPPLTWVRQDLLTLRLFDLIRVPYVDFDPTSSLHRTSLWSQIYGRTFFLRFDRGIWENPDPRLLWLGRLSLLLGLLPLAALLAGGAVLLASVARGIAGHGLRRLGEHHDWHCLVYVVAVAGALVAVVVRFHHMFAVFTWMKAIYLLPVVVPLFQLLMIGLRWLTRWAPRVVTAWMIALVSVSLVDLAWLLHDLSANGHP